MAHATTGDMGSFVHSREEISAIRVEEARRAAEIVGAEHRTLDLRDGEVNAADPAQKAFVVDLVRDARPDLIVTHAPNDYMGDHNEISKLVFECSFYATFQNLQTGRPRHEQ
jgi:LmbE family N-acetylglucosaminyl deacetylase